MTTQTDLHFGALAVRNGYATPSEIDLALEAQKEPSENHKAPLKLGEILVEMGTLTRTQIDSVLESQARLRDLGAAATGPAVQFEEILPATLTQESGPALAVNGEPLTTPRTLKPGDRLKAGDWVLQFSGEPLEIRPKAAAPVEHHDSTSVGIPLISPSAETPPKPEEKPAAPAAPKPKLSEKILPVLRAIDGIVAKIPPALHTQRKYVLAAAGMCWLAILLPWRIASNGNSVLGIQGPGWLTALLALVPAGITLFSRPGEPFTRTERIVATGASGLALLVGLIKFAFSPSYAASRGIGLYLGVLATAALLAAGAFARAGGGAASDAPTLGARLWKKLSGFLGSMSGKRAKELTAAIERRDALIRTIGEAALAAHGSLPEAAAAIQAREAHQKAEKEAGEAGAAVKSKAALKSADAKSKRAFGKLAQKVLDGGLALAGQEAAIAELRTLEARVKELSS